MSDMLHSSYLVSLSFTWWTVSKLIIAAEMLRSNNGKIKSSKTVQHIRYLVLTFLPTSSHQNHLGTINMIANEADIFLRQMSEAALAT